MGEQPVPEWLNREFLQGLVDDEVAEFTVTAAVPPGNNYGSCVVRVSIRLRHREDPLSLIIKSELTTGAVKEHFDTDKCCEHYFYYTFLPEAKKIRDVSFLPKNFPSPRQKTIILEDLKEQGFEMADRCKQLDFDHCKLYVIAAAEFHVVSLAVHKTHPDIVEAMGEEMLFADGLKGAEFTKVLIKRGLKCFLEATENMDIYKKARSVVMDVAGDLWDLVVDAHKRRDGLNTINQGDPWTTNMMFRYDENRSVTDIKILDFQALRFGSPMNDLVFFLWGSANNEVKKDRLIELYKIYIDHFNKNLGEFKCSEKLTFEELNERVKRLSPLIVMIALVYSPLTLNPSPIDFSDVLQDETFYKTYYNERFCSYHLPNFIEQMEKYNVLEDLKDYHKNIAK